MRSEREIIDMILKYATDDDGVRSVLRTDLVPVKDYLYKYNFCFIVNDLEKYNGDEVFLSCFGDRILLFRGDKNYPDMFSDTKVHMMVFRDGITLVINVMDTDAFLRRYNGEDRSENVWISDTYVKLLDKDGILPPIKRIDEKQTLFEDIPDKERYIGICNEFWWVMKTFAEYALREEFLSAMFYLNVAVRDMLNQMLRWHIYLRERKPVDMGILDSNMENLLEDELYSIYKKTYPAADHDSITQAFEAAVQLWSTAGSLVAQKLDFDYPDTTEQEMLSFIRRLRDIKASKK